jgi:23S rRNA G2445 N2-methylase RlmL
MPWRNHCHMLTPTFLCVRLQGALKLAQQAAKAAGVQQCISLHHGQCGDWQLPMAHSDQRHQALLAVCNPPWGLRLLAGEFKCSHAVTFCGWSLQGFGR